MSEGRPYPLPSSDPIPVRNKGWFTAERNKRIWANPEQRQNVIDGIKRGHARRRGFDIPDNVRDVYRKMQRQHGYKIAGELLGLRR